MCFAEISQETAVNPVDIVSTLQSLQMLKYWKGKHLVLKRQVTTKRSGTETHTALPDSIVCVCVCVCVLGMRDINDKKMAIEILVLLLYRDNVC